MDDAMKDINEGGQGYKAAMLVGAVLMTVSAITCSASITMPKSEPLPWLTAVGLLGFLAGLGCYVVGRVVIWWRR